MADRDPWAERYNRRTRALERQAAAEYDQARALERIAHALETQALAGALSCEPTTPTGTRTWKTTFASAQQERLSKLMQGLGR